MSTHATLQPQFFVIRHNGARVPLIAMDELPIHVQVRNVPRTINSASSVGMICIGRFEARHEYHIVEGINNTMSSFIHNTQGLAPFNGPVTPQLTPNIQGRPTLLNIPSVLLTPKSYCLDERRASGSTSRSSVTTGEPSSAKSKPSEPTQPSIIAVGPGTKPASESIPAWRQNGKAEETMRPTGKKIYCAYWLRKGECDFAQQGCMYKHVMPLDLETLNAAGFTDIPSWYRQKFGLGSLLVENGQSKPSFGVADAAAAGRQWRVGEEAKRTIRNQIGAANCGRGGKPGGNRAEHIAKRNAIEAEDARKRKEEIEAALRLEAEAEKERKALAAKYKSLRPEYRSMFAHEDLDSDTFSNGEEPNDVMAQIRRREQAGWEEEQAEAKARAAAGTAAGDPKPPSKKAGSGKSKRSGGSRGGGRGKKQ